VVADSEVRGLAILKGGAVLALVLAVAALVVTGWDSLWERRRLGAILTCVGVPSRSWQLP